SGTPRPIPHVARGRVPRPLEPGCEFLPGAGPGLFLSADRGCGRVAADGRASPRKPAPAAGVLPGLLRRLLDSSRPGADADVPGAPHETLGGREGRPHRSGIDSPKSEIPNPNSQIRNANPQIRKEARRFFLRISDLAVRISDL